MSGNVSVKADLQTAEAEAKLLRLQGLATETVQKGKEARRKVMQDVSMAMTNISTMMSSFSMAMHLLGSQVDAFYGALIGMTLSTISMMISSAAGLAATGVGIPASIIVLGIAATLQSLTILKLVNDKLHSEGVFKNLLESARAATTRFAQTGPRAPMGGF